VQEHAGYPIMAGVDGSAPRLGLFAGPSGRPNPSAAPMLLLEYRATVGCSGSGPIAHDTD